MLFFFKEKKKKERMGRQVRLGAITKLFVSVAKLHGASEISRAYVKSGNTAQVSSPL